MFSTQHLFLKTHSISYKLRYPLSRTKNLSSKTHHISSKTCDSSWKIRNILSWTNCLSFKTISLGKHILPVVCNTRSLVAEALGCELLFRTEGSGFESTVVIFLIGYLLGHLFLWKAENGGNKGHVSIEKIYPFQFKVMPFKIMNQSEFKIIDQLKFKIMDPLPFKIIDPFLFKIMGLVYLK